MDAGDDRFAGGSRGRARPACATQAVDGTALSPGDTGDDVVVCGRSSDADRIGTIPDYSKPMTLPKARTEIAGVGTVSAEAEQVDVGGMPSKRAMIRLTIPLGGRRKP
ncbi:hypothetical protein [Sphingomonas sp. Leaf257]|uniref:hypothetical protein n=1 Tax=Sphingomonas sp. Leaf257 TaxID=1736309 RepID=UPI0006F53CD4|nr:hypothetical protein [Sphingomonas sp. Leaf257]KQO52697.1 hypothetical protein ASF14_05195 [Sphingomonas sp. Leaf257]